MARPAVQQICPTDRWLLEVAEALQRRRRALAYHGVIALDVSDAVVRASIQREARRFTIELEPANRACLTVHSVASADRGKLLLRRDELRLVNQPDAIALAFERTAGALGADDLVTAVLDLWTPLALEVW